MSEAFDTRICSLEPLVELQSMLAEVNHKSSSHLELCCELADFLIHLMIYP